MRGRGEAEEQLVRWLVAVLVLLALAGVVVAFAGPRIAGDVVAGRVAALEADVAAATGGDVEVQLATSPVETVRRALADELPTGTVVVTDGRLPVGSTAPGDPPAGEGVRFRRAELVVDAGPGPGTLTLWLPPAAIEEQVGVDAVGVAVADGRLRLRAGPLSVPVRASVVDGRLVLDVPGLPAPLDGVVSARLSNLVPAPPDGVTLTDVSVRDGEVVVTAAVDLDVFVDELRPAP